MRRIIFSVTVLMLFFLFQNVSASPAAGYRVDWHNHQTGGGGPASSASYKANFTVGQTVSGTSSSSRYKVNFGYWAGADGPGRYAAYLPAIRKP